MLSEADAGRRLLNEEFQFPPLNLVERNARPGVAGELRPDWTLTFEWEGQTERFAVEYKSLSTPKRLEDALNRLLQYEGDSRRPLLMTTYLDEDWLDRLLELGVSGLDFSGNGVIVVPGQWLVYRTGAPNAFPATQYIKAIYSGRSSLVPRVLLLEREFDRVSGIRAEIEERGGTISLATVSKVLSRLEEELLISREGGRIRLLQADELLERMARNYDSPEITRRVRGTVDALDTALAAVRSRADEEGFRVVGGGERLYTVFPGSERTLSLYTENAPSTADAMEIRETRRFPDVEILETGDEPVYFDARERKGFLWTSPVQSYLDLTAGGKREQEVAEQLREALLVGEYG